MDIIDLTFDSDGEENQSSEYEEETDEFPYQCLQCPEKFKEMNEAQTHFFQNHHHHWGNKGKT